MTTSRRRRAALVLGLLVLLSGCSGAGNDEGGDASFDAVGNRIGDEGGGGGGDLDEGQATGGESAAGEPGAGPSQADSVDLDAAAEDRQVISTASVALTVDELDVAVDAVTGLVDDAGGLIYGEETDLREGALTHLTVKVPPSAFRPVLDALSDVGEVETQTVSTDDVTDQVVDLDSRIATAEASVERLRLLLDRAERIQDITTIEGQLLQRETDLETLRGQRRTIERQVALATIDVTLSAERTSPPPPEEDDDQTGFTDGLRGGADALRTFAVGASAVVGALLPWSPLLLVGGFVVWRTTRRRPA
jgi:hypothetical protein